MVINVLYFNSIWKDKFIKEDTEKQKFHVGEKIYMVDMMKRLNATEEIAKAATSRPVAAISVTEPTNAHLFFLMKTVI